MAVLGLLLSVDYLCCQQLDLRKRGDDEKTYLRRSGFCVVGFYGTNERYDIQDRMKELQKHNLSARQSSMLIVLEELDKKGTPAEVSKWVFHELACPHKGYHFLS